MNDRRRPKPKVESRKVVLPYPISSDEELPANHAPAASSVSPVDRKMLFTSSSSELGGTDTSPSSTRGRVGTGVHMVERPQAYQGRSDSPESVATERQPEGRRTTSRLSRQDTEKEARPNLGRSAGRPESRYADDRDDYHDRAPSHVRSDNNRRRRDDDEALIPSQGRGSRDPPTAYGDDRRRHEGSRGYDDDRYGRSDQRSLAPELGTRGLSQVRDPRYDRVQNELSRSRPGSRLEDDRDSGTSRQLVRTVPGPERDPYDRSQYDEDPRDARRPAQVSRNSSWRDSDEARRDLSPVGGSRYDDYREQPRAQRDLRGRESDETEKGRRERRRGYDDDDDRRQERDDRRGTSRRGSNNNEKARYQTRESRDRDDRQAGRVPGWRESDETEKGRRPETTSGAHCDDRLRPPTGGRDKREESPLPRHAEPGPWETAKRYDDRRYDERDRSPRRDETYASSRSRPTYDIPIRARSPDRLKQTSGGGSSRVQALRQSEASQHGREKGRYERDDRQTPEPLPTRVSQVEVSDWEAVLEGRPTRARQGRAGGSDGDRRSEARSAGSDHTARAQDLRGSRQLGPQTTVSRDPPSRVDDKRTRREESAQPVSRSEDKGKRAAETVSSQIQASQFLGPQDRSKYTDRENSRLDALALKRKMELDAWQTKALSDIKGCGAKLSDDLKSQLDSAISGDLGTRKSGRKAGRKGWGEVYNWKNSDGQYQFRPDRHAFVKATTAQMTQMVESTYTACLADGSRRIPTSAMSIDNEVKSDFDGKDGVSVSPSATITVGDWKTPGPNAKPRYFKKRSIWS